MTTLRNSFDGGVDGSVITVAGSGGASGDPLGYVSGSVVYSSTHAHSGTLSAKLPAAGFRSVGHELPAPAFWIRFYAWLQGHYTGSLVRLWTGLDASGTYSGGINTRADGTLDLICGGATVNLSGTVPLNAWVRLEGFWSTTGGAELRRYNSPESLTVSGSVTTAANLAGSVSTQEVVRVSVATDAYLDDFDVSSDGWIGPTNIDMPPRPVFLRSAVHRAASW
ncbi:hypothetical protein DQ384_05490 [Sphaerisporangium album]|uniref:LamG domain-containing protein n=1 Tax=Sphaerisporangium album TaxID=509200 RepID=A0A367FNL8_9ACTN|nr:hypothetical protein [Sphaerisporangium album]RCG31996.1 hypothetical protein DQ384_05490 [Sphaerisporangium album]